MEKMFRCVNDLAFGYCAKPLSKANTQMVERHTRAGYSMGELPEFDCTKDPKRCRYHRSFTQSIEPFLISQKEGCSA